MITTVLFINVLDDFFASIMLDVEIDIRRLCPLIGNKAFEQQVHVPWINGRNTKAVTKH
jgi:hypothetical protein